MFSVVIPAYNEEKLIGACLDGLVLQNTTHKFEVIVVDNNSTDKTVDIALRYKRKLDLKIITQKVKGRGAARQKGFQKAKGEIILSTDADTVVPPFWVEQLSHALLERDGVAVTGPCKITDCSWFTNTIFNVMQPLAMRTYKLIFGHYWLSGFNSAIYKEAYKKSGGFNVKLNAQEDVEIAFRVSKIGNIIFIPSVKVIFSGRRFQKGFIRGIVPYLTSFINHLRNKDERVMLRDVR
ncbi:hypothetical protein A2Z00_05005 [Candidatus Gottesmanbacteria bacterium RBG_13_45_10]|uniref:Glycosyltransferase 2-like domain-containing protein n=1 Tax=Candidatus Gottesmanbacteria bacterium RBG_13_45_10 TaxID=1798370 RepID=A0A1F5ZGX8_9BACT|nr:MAG: hypothetical protein A2Z00_05005 [Candidatus Gottesmanbacteria bacterium RBG_13_45_10]